MFPGDKPLYLTGAPSNQPSIVGRGRYYDSAEVDEASPALSRPSLSKRLVAITIVVAVVRFAVIAALACRSATGIRAACS